MPYDLGSFLEDNTNRLEVKDYVDVKKQAAKLGHTIPDGIVLLPSSFKSAQTTNDLVYTAGTDTVKKLLVQAGVPAAKLEQDGQEYPHAVQHTLEWIGPVILFTAAAVSQNPAIISVALGVISNYLTDWFRGEPKENRSASLTIVKETKDGDYKSVDYSGPPEGLSKVADILDRFDDEKQS
jgi:hypothetical protein